MWINGGYIVLDEEIFDDLRPGEDLVGGAFPRLADMGKLSCYRHTGNWIGVDTFKERQLVEDLYLNGNPFWAVWKRTCDGQPC
jgi:glucose-1-phosphate cytidylyltransferase